LFANLLGLHRLFTGRHRVQIGRGGPITDGEKVFVRPIKNQVSAICRIRLVPEDSGVA
jgi:hypothetical protein